MATLPNNYDITTYEATNGQTDFEILWVYTDSSDVFFTINEDDTVRISGDYTITPNSNWDGETQTGATLSLNVGLNAGDDIVIYRRNEISQVVNYLTNGLVTASMLKSETENIFLILQDLSENHLDLTDVDKVINFVEGTVVKLIPKANYTTFGLGRAATQNEVNIEHSNGDFAFVTAETLPEKVNHMIDLGLAGQKKAGQGQFGLIDIATFATIDGLTDDQSAVTSKKLEYKLQEKVYPFLTGVDGSKLGDIKRMHPDIAALDDTVIHAAGQEVEVGDYQLGTLAGYLINGDKTNSMIYDSRLDSHSGSQSVLTPNLQITGTDIYLATDTGLDLQTPSLIGDAMTTDVVIALDKLLLSENGNAHAYEYNYDTNILLQLNQQGAGFEHQFGEIIFGHKNLTLNKYIVLHIQTGTVKLESSSDGVNWITEAVLPELGTDLVKPTSTQEFGENGSLNYSNGKYYIISKTNFSLWSIDESNLTTAASLIAPLDSETPFYYRVPVFSGLFGMFQEHVSNPSYGTGPDGEVTFRYTVDGGSNWITTTFLTPNFVNGAPIAYHILDSGAVIMNHVVTATSRLYVCYDFFIPTPVFSTLNIYNDSFDINNGGFVVSKQNSNNVFYIAPESGAIKQDLYTRDFSEGGKLLMPDLTALDDTAVPQKWINVVKAKL